MKQIIVLRHGEKEGDRLTPAGIAACKRLARVVGQFDCAVASPRNRAVQTAGLVSGLPVRIDIRASVPGFPDSELAGLESMQQTHPLGIIGAIWQRPSLIEHARVAGLKLLDLTKESMSDMGKDQRTLIVSHDGTMIALEKLLRHEPFDTVNRSFGPLQGFVIDEAMHVSPFTP